MSGRTVLDTDRGAEARDEGGPGPGHPAAEAAEPGASGPFGRWLRGRRRRGGLTAVAAVLCALVMALHAQVPNWPGNAGSLLETVLPWTGLIVVGLLVVAAVRRSVLAGVAVLVPAVTWFSLFAWMLVDKRSTGGDLMVVSHNVSEGNPDPRGTARELAASGADVLALEELPRDGAGAYERELASVYRYAEVRGGVGVWSKYPLKDVAPVEIMPWTRALRATVVTRQGPLALYVAHLASVRVHPRTGFATARRDEAAVKLAERVRAERLRRIVVLGDFNGAVGDRALRPLTAGMRSAQDEAGEGFGLTWPAAFPVIRIDQVLVRGVSVASSWTLPATGSDHLPVAATLRL